MSMKKIDAKAQAYATACDVLAQAQIDLRKILRDATAEMLPSVRKQAEKVAKLETELIALVEANPELFPDGAKTQIIYEIKLGYQKQKDTVPVDDQAEVIAAIRGNLNKNDDDDEETAQIRAGLKKKAKALITVKESLSLNDIKKLSDAELELLGLSREVGGDAVFVGRATADIDKLVALLVPEAV